MAIDRKVSLMKTPLFTPVSSDVELLGRMDNTAPVVFATAVYSREDYPMSGDDDYDDRCEATKLNRLIRMLADTGVLTEYGLVKLAYPSIEDIEAAEAGEVL